MFPAIRSVSSSERLLAPADIARIVVSVDAQLVPCTRDQATSLVAELFGAYPSLGLDRKRDGNDADFKLYAVKLHEAFSQFSYAIGKAIVNGGTGVPAKTQYRPQPSDVVAFGKAEVERRLSAKTMALRHRAEAERREQARIEEADWERNRPDRERRMAQVAAEIARLKATPIIEPIAPRGPYQRPSEELMADLARRKMERSKDELESFR